MFRFLNLLLLLRRHSNRSWLLLKCVLSRYLNGGNIECVLLLAEWWFEQSSVAAWKRSWTWKVLIFLHLVFTREILESLWYILLCLKSIPCTDSKNLVLDIFEKCCRQLNFAVAFRVNTSKYQNILLAPIIANSPLYIIFKFGYYHRWWHFCLDASVTHINPIFSFFCFSVVLVSLLLTLNIFTPFSSVYVVSSRVGTPPFLREPPSFLGTPLFLKQVKKSYPLLLRAIQIGACKLYEIL